MQVVLICLVRRIEKDHIRVLLVIAAHHRRLHDELVQPSVVRRVVDQLSERPIALRVKLVRESSIVIFALHFSERIHQLMHIAFV